MRKINLFIILSILFLSICTLKTKGQNIIQPNDTTIKVIKNECLDTTAILWNIIKNARDSLNRLDSTLVIAQKEISSKSNTIMRLNLFIENPDTFSKSNAEVAYHHNYINGIEIGGIFSVAPGMRIVGDGGMLVNRLFKNSETVNYIGGVSTYLHQEKHRSDNSTISSTWTTAFMGIGYTDKINHNNSLHLAIAIGVESAFPPEGHLEVFSAWLCGDFISSIRYQYGNNLPTGSHWYDATLAWYIPGKEYRITGEACKNLGYGISFGKISKIHQWNRNSLFMNFDIGFYVDKSTDNEFTPRIKVAYSASLDLLKKLYRW